MTTRIRSEEIRDYYRIAEINALAFAPYLKEPLTGTFVSEFRLVDALRNSRQFDPELSLVAEVGEAVVGHALFYPYRAFVAGQEMRAVSLGPIAVDPALQRQGIGGRLLLEGHHRARAKGYAYSFLLGHSTYYPRFGYLTSMFGECCLELRVDDIPNAGRGLAERLVQQKDVGWLVDAWRDWFAEVDLAVFPGDSILDWISQSPGIMTLVIEQDGDSIGYLRYDKREPARPKLFLPRSKTAVPLLLAHLGTKINHATAQRLRIPLAPESRAGKTCLDLPFQPRLAKWPAAMVKILDDDNSIITEYCEQVGSGQRAPGLVIWPPSFEPV